MAATKNLFSSRNLVAGAAIVVVAILPLFSDGFFIEFVMTRTLMLGLAASTIVFLSAYVGMDSLAQWLIFGVAGFAYGNMVAESGRGLALGWNPWLAVPIAIAVCTITALVLGGIAARSTGIYFLMLTLTYAVIGFFFFGQVTTFSGFGGMTGIDAPELFEGHPVRLFYAAWFLSILAYVGFRAIGSTPFGMALQGVRDDPVRMASLGFNVQMHRALAFTLAGFVASFAGLLNIWWNGQIDPSAIGMAATFDLFIIAVIGGIVRLEGAWLGAFVFIAANIYLRDIPGLGSIGGVIESRILAEERFNTVVGLLLLIIMLVSPDGLAGILARLGGSGKRSRTRETTSEGSTSDGSNSVVGAVPESGQASTASPVQ